MNFGYLFEMMFLCISWCFTTLSKYNRPISCAILLTLSTTTKMESNPLDSRRWIMKSIKMFFQYLVGMGMVLTIQPLCETEFYFAGKSHISLHIAPHRPASLANSNSLLLRQSWLHATMPCHRTIVALLQECQS